MFITYQEKIFSSIEEFGDELLMDTEKYKQTDKKQFRENKRLCARKEAKETQNAHDGVGKGERTKSHLSSQ